MNTDSQPNEPGQTTGNRPGSERTIEALLGLELPVSISFGRARIELKNLLGLAPGSVVELDRSPADLVDVIVKDIVIARGELVAVDGNYAVRVREVIDAPGVKLEGL
jgi:flagellar motor switch protein FliN